MPANMLLYKHMKILLSFVAMLLLFTGCNNAQIAQTTPSEQVTGETAEAIFAGGCFWCVEAGFEAYPGVTDAISGYIGGSAVDAEYQKVAAGQTDHYEAVKVLYNPELITYQDLLEIFWRQFDPTDDGGSFVDRGTQYKSGIFYQTEKEKVLAERSKQGLIASGIFEEPIVTPILQAGTFYQAEQYHQNYYKTNSAHYKQYRKGSGRDQFIERVWGNERMYTIARQLSTAELKNILTEEQFHITQQDGTERPFANAFFESKEKGIYVDLISGEPLFSSKDKFDSGTGWPSFTKPIYSHALTEGTDLKIGYPRTELRSAISDAHLGHVFEDGPLPSKLRYCINSAALRFVPVEKMVEEGYGEFFGGF